jgi:GT2 family glycosyltransferase
MPKVSIVIVCMNRPDILFPCLDSIREHTTVSYETLVVAYMFSPENLETLRGRYPWVTIIPSMELRGFSENNNLALKAVSGRYCLILNDDTLLRMPLIDTLVKDLESLPESAAAVSPCIRFPDGRVQTCGRDPWTPWRYAKHYLHLVDESPIPSSSIFQTYTLNGACFLIKTKVFREAGWFDERFFFTPEDIALGHKLNDMGYTVWANPEVSVTHLAGGSVSALEQAIKPARVRGSMIFYGEPLWLKCFIWCFEALRAVKYFFLPRKGRNVIMRKSALNVMKAVFSSDTPKEIFKRFRP